MYEQGEGVCSPPNLHVVLYLWSSPTARHGHRFFSFLWVLGEGEEQAGGVSGRNGSLQNRSSTTGQYERLPKKKNCQGKAYGHNHCLCPNLFSTPAIDRAAVDAVGTTLNRNQKHLIESTPTTPTTLPSSHPRKNCNPAGNTCAWIGPDSTCSPSTSLKLPLHCGSNRQAAQS